MVVASCYLIDYTGRFYFPVTPSELWAAIERLEQFEHFWGWLSDLSVDGPALEAGTVLRGTVAPPVPYRMYVEVELTECVPERLIDADVTGDLAGVAHLRIRPCPQGTVADVEWSLEMLQAPMRMAARVAHPLLKWGHDRVVDATVAGFRYHLRRDPTA